HIKRIRNEFDEIDIDASGSIDCVELLEHVDVMRSPFTDAVWASVGVDPAGRADVSDVVRVLVTFCLHSREEILRFCFNQFDVDGSGTIDEQEFVQLVTIVNNASPMFPGNFARALEEFDTNDDGLIDFHEFKEVDKRYPLILFPAFKLQDCLQRKFLGIVEWTRIAERLQAQRVVQDYQKLHGGRSP
ncbi:unnamed protein product, partial [Phaeothamnion confervicola]